MKIIKKKYEKSKIVLFQNFKTKHKYSEFATIEFLLTKKGLI